MSPGAAIIQVEVRDQGGRRRVSRRQTHFMFGDGCFRYDCHACGAQCCRGHGFLLHRDFDLDGCLETAPDLALFADEARDRGSGTIEIGNCAPNCFFLDSEGLCRLQRQNGLRAKPQTCRLFPFNVIREFDEHLIVLPHISLCPLAVVESQSRPESSHELLFAEMAEQGICGPLPHVAHAIEDATERLELEDAVVREAGRRLIGSDYLEFAGWQMEVGGLSGAAGGTQEADLFRLTLCTALGLEEEVWTNLTDVDVRTLVHTTPIVRAQMRLGTNPLADHVSSARATRVMIGLSILAAVAKRAGMREVSYQTLTQLFRSSGALLDLLSFLDSPATVREAHSLDWPSDHRPHQQEMYIGVLKALLRNGERPTLTVAEILDRHVRLEGLNRILFLKKLARCLSGLIGYSGRRPRVRPISSRVRTGLQRYVLRTLPTPALVALADTMRGKSGTN